MALSKSVTRTGNQKEWFTDEDRKGVEYRFHKDKKYGAVPDRYFRIRFRVDGKSKVEGLGWASEGWTPTKAAELREQFVKATKMGDGPTSLKEMRELAEAEKLKQEAEERAREAANISFKDYFENVYMQKEEVLEKKKNTIRTEVALAEKWLFPTIGKKPLKDINKFDAFGIKSKIKKASKSDRTVQYVLQILGHVLNLAKEDDLFFGNSPVMKAKKKLKLKSRDRYLSREEAEKLLQALRQRSIPMYEISLVSLNCGLRFGEVASLRWEDVKTDQNTLTARDTKNGTDRTVYMTEAVKQMFQDKIKGNPSDLVFPNRNGTQRADVSDTFERVVKEIGLNDGITNSQNKIVFHSLRHTCASWLVIAGVSLYKVQKLLGHSSHVMTERYAHLAPDCMQEMAGVIDSPPPPKEEKRPVRLIRGRSV